MKIINTIVFSIVLLQQIMNHGVQADTPCNQKQINMCNNFKKSGQLCTCGTETAPGPIPFILPSACEATNPKGKQCAPYSMEISKCVAFCNLSGKSCSAADACVGV
ncbi:hypothetical protein K501DRAFT_267296 [Backusella circina FSU 941]|nr:hypothetical protein K501DRAFT_267296 [Backusella circina FSU 941]